MYKNTINGSSSLLEALKKINSLSNESLTLFVLDDDNKVRGTVTDGDIRRYLVSGGKLSDSISNVMHTNFSFIKEGEPCLVLKLREMKSRGISLVPLLNTEGHIINIYDLSNYKSYLPVDAVLMAGGKGERLRPLTENIPKPLLEVGGKCIIDHNVDRLISYGVKHINVTINYLGEQIEEHFMEPRSGVQVKCFREPKFLGTIGSIRYVTELYNDVVLVMNSDVFTNLDFEDFYLHFKEYNADMSVCAVPYSVKVPYGIFEIEGKRDIKGIVEKPTYDLSANAGIYLIKRELLDMIPADVMFHSTDLLSVAVEAGKKVIRFPLNGTWIDIGNPQEYKRANELVKHMRW